MLLPWEGFLLGHASSFCGELAGEYVALKRTHAGITLEAANARFSHNRRPANDITELASRSRLSLLTDLLLLVQLPESLDCLRRHV